MTGYNREELADDWEFKILRSATGAFGNPAKMQRFLEEEAVFGWVLVEKFDNQRLRLKRRANAKPPKGEMSGDPYRTNVGISQVQLLLFIIVGMAIHVAVLGAMIAVAKA